MTLTLRRAKSRFIPVWDADKFWSVICEDTIVGAIVQSQGAGAETFWGWSIIMLAPASALVNKSGREATRDEAMAAFRRAWDVYGPEIGDGWWRRHLDHCEWLDEQAERWRRQREGLEPGGYG